MSIQGRIARAESAAASLGAAGIAAPAPALDELQPDHVAVLLSSAPIDDFVGGVDADREAIIRGLWAEAHALAVTLSPATRAKIEDDLRGMGYFPAGVA